MGNRLAVVINSNYPCSKLCCGRCRVETGESNYGHPGLKMEKLQASMISYGHTVYVCRRKSLWSVVFKILPLTTCYPAFQDTYVDKKLFILVYLKVDRLPNES